MALTVCFLQAKVWTVLSGSSNVFLGTSQLAYKKEKLWARQSEYLRCRRHFFWNFIPQVDSHPSQLSQVFIPEMDAVVFFHNLVTPSSKKNRQQQEDWHYHHKCVRHHSDNRLSQCFTWSLSLLCQLKKTNARLQRRLNISHTKRLLWQRSVFVKYKTGEEEKLPNL